MYRKFIILLFLATVYLLSIGSDPILGDSLVFTVVASKGFDFATNATNHFLYINLIAFLHKLFPFINPHYLFTCFSIICSLLTLFFIHKLFLLFHLKQITADILLLLFGFSFTFWRISVITEVYSFYILFATLFFYSSFSYIKNKTIAAYYWSMFLFGIMFLIHIQTILLIPFYLFYLYKNSFKNWSLLLLGILVPTLIFSLLFIPVLLGKHNVMAVFTDNAWGKSFFNFDLITSIKSLLRNTAFLIYNFLFFVLFIFKGCRTIQYKEYHFLILLPCVLFILKHDVPDSYVFQLVPYLIVLIIIGKGLESFRFKSKILLPFIIPAFYFTFYRAVSFTQAGSNLDYETNFKGGIRYYFFPALRGNPTLESFINTYKDNKIKDRKILENQYRFAKEWMLIKKEY